MIDLRLAIKGLYLAVRNAALSLCIRPRKAAHPDPGKVQKILAVRLDRIGDMVVSEPALRTLHELFPRARLTVLTRPETLPLLRAVPWIDEVLVYGGFFKTAAGLRRQRFSLAIDLLMDYTLKTALLVRLSNAAVTAGFDIAGRGRVFSIAVKPAQPGLKMYQHTLELVRQIAAQFGIRGPTGDRQPHLILCEDQKRFKDDFYRKNSLEGRMCIGIHPGAKFPSQRWQPEKFVELGDRICAAGAKVILIASRPEQALAEGISAAMKSKPVVSIGLPLDKTVALISGMRIFVCNNSGPLHIAAALGVSTVSTMGPTDPVLWAPAGEKAVVIRRELSCSPCNRAVCAVHECLGSITVSELWQAVQGQLARAK
ncbi:MAG: glycosyltransferase family 9 protein [Candidatus Omnitrophica bacterium]|nr:glycosyltransferase family 9 protein [Candidatus Omnitrophota bacterium]